MFYLMSAKNWLTLIFNHTYSTVDTEEIKKRLKQCTEKLYKHDPNEPDYFDGMVSHPEPDILHSEVKWDLGSTAVSKASEWDGIPVELLKTLKDDAIKE